MKRAGFTAVELLVVIIIMAILLTLAVVNVRSTQVQARDNERIADVENIALALESFYTTEHDNFRNTYPGVIELPWFISNFANEMLNEGSLRAPGVEDDTVSLIRADNSLTPDTGLEPMPTTSTYVYQPLMANGNLCIIVDGPCRRFNMYYRLEAPTPECPAPYNICTLRSVRS